MEDRPAREGGMMPTIEQKVNYSVSKPSSEKAANFLRAATVAALLNAGFPIGGVNAETQKNPPPFPKEAPNLIQEQGMPSQNLERNLNQLGAKIEDPYHSVRVETSQTITETFSGIKLDQPSRRGIRGQFVERNAQDNAIEIWSIARTDSDMSSHTLRRYISTS